jgi:hypothetical protein
VLQPRPARRVGPGDRERVQRIRHGLQMLLGEMEIQHRVPDLHMAEEQLNRPEVRATLEQVRGIRMAERILTLPMNRLPRSFSTVTIPSTVNT